MDLDIDRLRHLAHLSALTLRDDEAPRLAREVSAILRYVAELEAVNTDGISPTAHLAFADLDAEPLAPEASWREDAARDGLSRDEALAGAPRTEADGFAVPGFVE
jgi:aspartyl-tRNA(Asn)/glutamyl-tRNA(Gln) amidotransferase subunit C